MPQKVGGGGGTYALEASANEVDTNKEWKPEGNIVAQGEDGVPWELYENGYLLFKPEDVKDTLTNNQHDITWKKQYGMQIKAIGFKDKVYAPEDSSYLFSRNTFVNNITKELLPNLEYVDANKIDTSKVKNMSSMFAHATNLTKIDVSNWDTSNVTNMSRMWYMFTDENNITDLNVSNWNTSKVTDMSGMFVGLNKITKLDVSNWDVSHVKNMSEMFFGLSKLTTLNVSRWNTEQVEDIHSMFVGMSSLTNIDVSNWNVSNVTNMGWMFQNTGLTSLNINKWDVKNVEYMSGMFFNAISLTNLDLSNWNINNVTYIGEMFGRMISLNNLNVSNWDTSNILSMNGVFKDATSLTSLDLSNWDTKNIVTYRDIYDFFQNNTKLKKLKLGKNFYNTSYSGNLLAFLDSHSYKNVYTNRWVKEDGSAGPFTVEEWDRAYRNDPVGMSGTWVREKTPTKYTLNFETRTTEQINPTEVEKDTQATLPTPTVDNTGYKFLGWTKTQDGEVITDTTNIANPNETITLYAKWEKVNNITTERTPIEVTTVYQGDNTLDKGQRNEEEGQVGEKEIITTYKVTPITGELTEPTTIEKIITPMKPKVVKVGTKPTEIEKRTELPVTAKQIDTLVRGKERIIQGRPRIEKEIIEYTVNEITGYITESKRVEVVDEGTPTIKEIGTREPNTIIRDVNGKDLTDDELSNYTNLEPNPTNTTDNGDLVYIVHKIITKYKGNDTLELNKKVVEKDGKTDGVKLIQVGTKPTVNTIERDNKQIKQTTTYIVNEDTGELTPNTTEEIIGDVKPATSNGTEAPLTFELPEYTKPISTNTPIDENGDLVLPPIVDKLEYTGTLSTNTPVDDNGELILPPTYNKEEYNKPISTNTPIDKDGNLILPPIVDLPEYKVDIVNEPQKYTKEPQQSKTNNKQIPTEIYHKLDKQQDVKQDIVNTTESDNNNVYQKQTLPKTNALYSTPYVLGLLLSAIGLKHNKKD